MGGCGSSRPDPDGGDEEGAARWGPPEPSNGLDDNGNGVVDEGAYFPQYPCADPARCTCAMEYLRCGDACIAARFGAAMCGGACVLRLSDPAHCGACGNACRAGDTCSGGVCRCGSGRLGRCGEACMDLWSDPHNCGACGSTCFENTGKCLQGNCLCAPGFIVHDNRCHANGAAGLFCNPPCHAGTHCSGRMCICNSPLCGGICRDHATDPLHCGRCDNACPGGMACVDGRCV